MKYIRHLHACTGKHSSSVRVRNLVLIQFDGYKRLTWPLGMVEEVYPGRDGLVWSCKLKTQGGEIVRSIQKLHVLEME